MGRLPNRKSWARYSCLGCAALLAVTGCGGKAEHAPPLPSGPQLRSVRPVRRTIERTVGQPAFINAYEETSIFAKIAGYIQEWNVDIGDPLKKGQTILTLFVPELAAEYQQQKAQSAEDEAAIDVARQVIKVAENHLSVAAANVKQAEANLGSFQSEVDRWTSEVTRLTGLAAQNVVDKQILDESQKQLKSNLAKRDAAQANIAAAKATEAARQVDIDKARADLRVARAKAEVSRALVDRYAALLSYTTLPAPYDGIVVVRNANTGDFVQPAGGDKSVERITIGQAASKGAPLYVVARTDLVRVFVDVPEIDANHVAKGTPAHIFVQALGGAEIHGEVTRTSWALNVQSRTLRAEVDLPNPDSKLLPGMYAYARLVIKHPGVLALPAAAIVELGNQNYCYLLENGKAVKTAIQIDVSDGDWTEVTNKLVGGNWVPWTGNEAVLLGELSEISDGQEVHLTASK